MATVTQKRAAEQDFRCLLEDHGLPQPDAVVYDEASIRFLWHEEKLCVVVDIDENGTEWVSAVDQVNGNGIASYG